MKLSRKKFEEIVAEALDDLPEEIGEALSNVFVAVEQWPSDEILEKMDLPNRYQLLALYEGVPLTQRTTSYNALPDRITIFQGPIESIGRDESELRRQIKIAVVHEIAHHFGIGDKRLRELGY
jgi:predicted Zn-dependent protease with MMP-like domain